jgi:hypothetical protein
MNHDPEHPPADPGAIKGRVIAALRSHRLKIRLLSTGAFLFGFLALASSIGLAWSYFNFVLPRQTQMLEESEAFVQRSGTNSVAEPLAAQEAIQRIDRALLMQISVSRTIGVGTSMLAVAVGALGLGTLVLLLVSILSRRATLTQLNAGLAEISSQLRDLRTSRGDRPSA